MDDYKNVSLAFYTNKLGHLVKTFYERDFIDDDSKWNQLECIKNRAKDIIKTCELMQDKLDH